jgi:hypothetical protein
MQQCQAQQAQMHQAQAQVQQAQMHQCHMQQPQMHHAQALQARAQNANQQPMMMVSLQQPVVNATEISSQWYIKPKKQKSVWSLRPLT